MVSLELTILLVAFTIACAYFNHRSGLKQVFGEGMMAGMELTVKLLEAEKKI